VAAGDLDRLQRILDQHPSVESGTSRIIGDRPSFTVIRRDIILKIAEIVERAGTQLAGPTRLMYISAQAGMDAGRVARLEARER
jgi:hypothetical protein